MAFDPFGNLTRFAGLDQSGGSSIPGTSLEIRETGPEPRVITLRGRAMPYRGPEWPVEQHSKLTWYPGSPVATQQILGVRELPTTMEGFWKDRFLEGAIEDTGSLQPITSAEQAVELFEGLARSGRELRVAWGIFVRTGIIKRFTPRPDRVQDIAWTIEWEWASRNDEQRARAAQPSLPASQGFDLFNALSDAANAVAFATDLAAAFQAQIVSAIAEIGDLVSDLVDGLRLVETLVNLPGSVLGAISNTVGQLVRQLEDFTSRILSQRSSVNGTATVTTGNTSDPLSRSASSVGSRSALGQAPPASSTTSALTAGAYARNVARAAEDLRAYAVSSLLSVQRRYSPPATRIVTTQEGDTLFRLSTRLYGSPDYAGFLAAANRLQGSQVPPGFQLRVPPRPVSASALPEPSSSAVGQLGSPPETVNGGPWPFRS